MSAGAERFEVGEWVAFSVITEGADPSVKVPFVTHRGWVLRVQRSEAHPNLDRLVIVGEDGEEWTRLAFGVRREAAPVPGAETDR
jgi:hypothetical protein